MKLFCVSMIFISSFQSVSFGQNKAIFSPGQLRLLDSISGQDVPQGAPGIATGIVMNGKIIYEKAAGFADLTDSILITRNSRFNIASNGKQFTALAILVLADEKRIRLSDDIRIYLPAIYPNGKEKITIEHLVTHTSGIRDVYDLLSLQGITWWKQTLDNKDVLAMMEKQEELNFKPGSKFLYSNSNYILLAEIIERVTGRSFVAYTNALFKKLKMPNTSFEPDHTKIRGPIARAYFNFGTWTTYNWIWNVYGDGNLFSNLADQLRWEQILQGGASSKIKKHILVKSQELTEHSPVKNYGYGLEFDTYKGYNYKFHEGATGAWKATTARFPHKNISIITLANTGKATPNTQTRQMADVLFDLQKDSKYFVTGPALTGPFVDESDITGIYLTGRNFTFQFEKKDSVLYLKRAGRNDIQLERESENVWHQKNDPDFKQEFKKNVKGEIEVTAYHTSHAPYTLTKINTDWTGFNFKALNGKFLNIETNVIMEISYAGDRNYDVRIGNRNNTKGILISTGKLLVNNYIIDIESRAGEAATLFLGGDRIERVRFQRT